MQHTQSSFVIETNPGKFVHQNKTGTRTSNPKYMATWKTREAAQALLNDLVSLPTHIYVSPTKDDATTWQVREMITEVTIK